MKFTHVTEVSLVNKCFKEKESTKLNKYGTMLLCIGLRKIRDFFFLLYQRSDLEGEGILYYQTSVFENITKMLLCWPSL